VHSLKGTLKRQWLRLADPNWVWICPSSAYPCLCLHLMTQTTWTPPELFLE
jgi:hypothetical protein